MLKFLSENKDYFFLNASLWERKNALKKAKNVTPACVSSVSSFIIDKSAMSKKEANRKPEFLCERAGKNKLKIK